MQGGAELIYVLQHGYIQLDAIITLKKKILDKYNIILSSLKARQNKPKGIKNKIDDLFTSKNHYLGDWKKKTLGRVSNELQTQDSEPLVSAALKQGAGWRFFRR